MDAPTYKLVNMLERAPRETFTFTECGKKIVVKPAYLLLEDVERIIRLLMIDAGASSDELVSLDATG